MDNNETETSLRSFCLHRHAWKVIDTIEGTKASAIIYSITETAKANGLNPFRYMGYLLTELMEHLDDTDCSFWMSFYRGRKRSRTFAGEVNKSNKRSCHQK